MFTNLLNKKCMVFGSSGFIGRALVSRLNSLSVSASLFKHRVESFSDVNDFLLDADFVFNCACLADIGECLKDPVSAYKTNVMGVVNILEASKINKVNRVVLSSSNIAYGADTPYRSTILAGEHAGQVYSKNYGMSVISLRYANVYGPGERKRKLVVENFRNQAKNGKITIFGDGNQVRDFIHVNDVVNSMVTSACSDYCGIVDICTGVETSIRQLAEMFGCEIELTGERSTDSEDLQQNPDGARRSIGWEYQIPLKEGIKYATESI